MPTLYKDGEQVHCNGDQVDVLLGAGYTVDPAPAKKLSAIASDIMQPGSFFLTSPPPTSFPGPGPSGRR